MDFGMLFEEVKRTLSAELFVVGEKHITLGSLGLLVLILAATWLFSRFARRRLGALLARSGFQDKSTLGVVPRLAHFAILLAGLVAALQVFGIDLSTLFAAGAVFAVGLGFAMQNIAQNFVSGIILLVERSIKPGDVLEVEGDIVRVQKIGIRSAVVRTRNEEELIVPNSTLVQGTVKNYTLTDSSFLLGAQVGVVYSSDMRRVRAVLEETAAAVPWRDPSQEPRVLLRGFGDSSVDWTVFVWVDDPWLARRRVSQLNEAIWWALAEAGITIAFPQLDVHLDRPVEESLRRLGEIERAR